MDAWLTAPSRGSITRNEFQTRILPSYSGISAPVPSHFNENSLSHLTDIQESTTTAHSVGNADSSMLASVTFPITKGKVMLSAPSVNDIPNISSTSLSIEVFREDKTLGENKAESHLATSLAAKSSQASSDALHSLEHLLVVSSTTKNVAVLTDMSALSNDPISISAKSSILRPPAMEQVKDSTHTTLAAPTVYGALNTTQAYLQENSPTRDLSEGIWSPYKIPETSSFQTNPKVPSNIDGNYYYKSLSPSSEPLGSTRQTIASLTSHGSSNMITAIISPSMDAEENSSPLSTQTSQTLIFTSSIPVTTSSMPVITSPITVTASSIPVATSSVPAEKTSNGNDLTMSGSKASHYIQKQSLGIVLGSISGAGVVLCCIVFLHRSCYQRIREARKGTIWIMNDSENHNHGDTSFNRRSEYREISRFSVDS